MLQYKLKSAQINVKAFIGFQKLKFSSTNNNNTKFSNLGDNGSNNQSQQNQGNGQSNNTIYSDLSNIKPVQNEDNEQDPDFWYDVAIIGGGSGGLSLAFEAKKIGLKPIIFDYVDKSNQSYHWGIGGTCVNVGCIPKKFMHIASQIKEQVSDSLGYGWDFEKQDNVNQKKKKNKNLNQNEEKVDILSKFQWKEMVYNIRKYILDMNIFYEMKLQEAQIPYINAFATLHDRNTIVYSDKKQEILEYLKNSNEEQETIVSSYKQKFSQKKNNTKTNADKNKGNNLNIQTNLKSIKTRNIVLCTGGRPNTELQSCPDISKYAMTSDDFFFNQNNPGKTLVIGGGYIALECSGILGTLGNKVTLMTKGKYLKDFDQQMAGQIVENLKQFSNVKVEPTSLPYNVKKNNKTKKLEVDFQNLVTNQKKKEEFDSILIAIGRNPNTQYLNLQKLGIKVDSNSQKVLGNFNGEYEQTSVDNIYAIGDILDGSPTLTPVAQKAGRFLAKRLFYKNMTNLYKMDTTNEQQKFTLNYSICPTTIFTPSEYACVGKNQEEAEKIIGKNNLVIYHSRYTPLEQSLSENNIDPETFLPIRKKAYLKLICNKLNEEEIIGIHYLGPNAGEIMQGFSVLMNFAQQTKKINEKKQISEQENSQSNDNNSGLLNKLQSFLGNSNDRENNNKSQKEVNKQQQNLIFNKQFLDTNIGIHPTLAEEIVNLSKKGEENPDQESC